MLAFSLGTKQKYADTFSQGAELLIWQYTGSIHRAGTPALLSDKCDFKFLFYGYLIILWKDTTGDLGVSFFHGKVE